MEYTHVSSITEGLSDHTPLKITFPTCPKKKEQFKFCEIPVGSRLARFYGIIAQCQNRKEHEETQAYLFFQCAVIKGIWIEIIQWLNIATKQNEQEWGTTYWV